jgi:hypothetical protein
MELNTINIVLLVLGAIVVAQQWLLRAAGKDIRDMVTPEALKTIRETLLPIGETVVGLTDFTWDNELIDLLKKQFGEDAVEAAIAEAKDNAIAEAVSQLKYNRK